MALRLLLLRHGETAWNRERRYQGWTDTPLSATGVQQAEAAARELKEHAFAAVYASPLRRARDTAAVIARPHGLEVETDPAFRELGFGEWEGLTLDEARSRDTALYQNWARTPHLVSPPGAETLAQARERVLAGLERLRAGHKDDVVCLVAHGIPVRIMILEALGLGLDRIWSLHSAPTGISELEFRDDWTALHRMNTLVHLDTALADR
ncbi:MAG TPA: histidine phosphatase family protein [Candidatus Bathyarchaeia archaeon]|nr:histidine phosphatase family protein [Candidatus Bathyarchaeia archaeon]